MVPAATIWPAPLTLAAVRPQRSMAARTSVSSPPMTALIPVGVAALASAMERPRSRTKTIACSADRTPPALAAVISPTECPAPAPTRRKPSAGWENKESSATRPDATMSGCAIAVSLMVSASEVDPWVTRSTPATAESQPNRSVTPGNSSQGFMKPGVWEPCPGQTMTSTYPACRAQRYEFVMESDEADPRDLEVSSKGWECRAGLTVRHEGGANRASARAMRTVCASWASVRS